ncbi:MAG: hypothetical protein AAGC71_01610 [Pseudomonadota bacterium]
MVKLLTRSMVGLTFAFATPVYGQTAADYERCRAIATDADRLACYDNVASAGDSVAEPTVAIETAPVAMDTTPVANDGTEPTAPATVASPEPATTAAATTTVSLDDPVDLFGRSDKEIRDAAIQQSNDKSAPDRLTAAVASVSTTASGRFRITLDNEQTWTQTESARFRLREGDAVEIRRGQLGAYFLKKQGKNRSVRVRRIN